MKKVILTILLCGTMVLSITGCGKDKDDSSKKMLLCKNEKEKYVFNLDENNNSKGIYYENVFDFNYYYREKELIELKENKLINNIILEEINDCNNMDYACNSSFNDNKIINKIYLKNKEEAERVDLDKYYDIDLIDLRTKMVTDTDTICEVIDYNDMYIIKDNVTNIIIDQDTYNSVEELKYKTNMPKYYKEYSIVEIDGKKGTIEFKENGICTINLKDYNSESWSHIYCDQEKHKKMGKTVYLDGECNYTIINDYLLDITYTGKYESYSYCEENENNKMGYVSGNIASAHNHLIKIEFDSQYENIRFLNGVWRRKYTTSGPILYNWK